MFILIILGVCAVEIASGFNSSKSIQATGSIVDSRLQINVDTDNILNYNNYAMGFQLDGNDIRKWRDTAALRNLAINGSFKFVRFFEHRIGKPCNYWDESTKTGSWDWTDIDLLVRRILEIGAEPVIVLGFYSWTTNTLSSKPQGMNDNVTTGLPSPGNPEIRLKNNRQNY